MMRRAPLARHPRRPRAHLCRIPRRKPCHSCVPKKIFPECEIAEMPDDDPIFTAGFAVHEYQVVNFRSMLRNGNTYRADEVVLVVGIDGLLDGAHVDPSKAADGYGKGPISPRVIDRPVRAAVQPVAAASASAARGGIHEATEDQLRRVLIIRRQRGLAVAAFHRNIFADGRCARPPAAAARRHTNAAVHCGRRILDASIARGRRAAIALQRKDLLRLGDCGASRCVLGIG